MVVVSQLIPAGAGLGHKIVKRINELWSQYDHEEILYWSVLDENGVIKEVSPTDFRWHYSRQKRGNISYFLI